MKWHKKPVLLTQDLQRRKQELQERERKRREDARRSNEEVRKRDLEKRHKELQEKQKVDIYMRSTCDVNVCNVIYQNCGLYFMKWNLQAGINV